MNLQAVSSRNAGVPEVFGLNLRKNTNILSILDLSRQVPLENLKLDHDHSFDNLSSPLFATVQPFGAISVTDGVVNPTHTHTHIYSTATTKAHRWICFQILASPIIRAHRNVTLPSVFQVAIFCRVPQ